MVEEGLVDEENKERISVRRGGSPFGERSNNAPERNREQRETKGVQGRGPSSKKKKRRCVSGFSRRKIRKEKR